MCSLIAAIPNQQTFANSEPFTMNFKNKDLVQFLLPREHGAWAMWFIPFIIGTAAAGHLSANTLLIFGACFLAFTARTALGNAIRLRKRNKNLALHCASAGFLQLILLVGLSTPIILTGNYSLVMIGLIAAILFVADFWWIESRAERNLLTELLGVAGFALAAPAAYTASIGAWDSLSIVVWAIAFTYFSGSVFYVKLRLTRMSNRKRQNVRAEILYLRLTIGYVISAMVLIIVFSLLNWTSQWLVLAFLPWLFFVLREGYFPRTGKNVNRIGWTLVAHSVYFAIFCSLLFAFN